MADTRGPGGGGRMRVGAEPSIAIGKGDASGGGGEGIEYTGKDLVRGEQGGVGVGVDAEAAGEVAGDGGVLKAGGVSAEGGDKVCGGSRATGGAGS